MITLHERWSDYEQREAVLHRKINLWNCAVCVVVGIGIGFALTALFFAFHR